MKDPPPGTGAGPFLAESKSILHCCHYYYFTRGGVGRGRCVNGKCVPLLFVFPSLTEIAFWDTKHT